MSTIEAKYGTSNQAITCTLTSLASGAARSGLALDNTTTLFLDALVQVKVKTAAAGVSASGYVTVYAYGTADGGTTYGGGESGMGTDAAVTLTNPPNMRQIGLINANAASTTYSAQISVAQAFGGTLPDHWGIVVVNNTGAALDASVASAVYQGILAQSI